MFQSNKEYINFLIQSGVHTFLKETPNKLLENQQNQSKSKEKKDLKKLDEITEIEDRLAELTALRDQLAHLAQSCHGDHRPDCPILDAFSTRDGLTPSS